MAFIISLPALLDLLCGIDAIKQQLASKIEVLRTDSAAARWISGVTMLSGNGAQGHSLCCSFTL